MENMVESSNAESHHKLEEEKKFSFSPMVPERMQTR